MEELVALGWMVWKLFGRFLPPLLALPRVRLILQVVTLLFQRAWLIEALLVTARAQHLAAQEPGLWLCRSAHGEVTVISRYLFQTLVAMGTRFPFSSMLSLFLSAAL